MMAGGSVVRKRLTKPEAMSIVSATVSRLCVAHGKDRVAIEAGCDERTIRHARDERSLLSVDFLANLLTLDGSALDELAAYFGMRLVPLDAADNTDARLLADASGLVATLADAMADGRIDHQEEQRIAAQARPVVRELAGRIAVADRKRVG